MGKVIVVVVTYNAMSWINKTLSGLNGTNVVVVDNLSEDGTTGHIKKKFPSVILIQNTFNRGFGAANNQGILKAIELGATHIFLLNQDAWLRDGRLEDLVKVLEQNKDFGITSPVHFEGTGKEFDFGFKEYLVKDRNCTFLNDWEKGVLEPVYPVRFVNAAAWMVPVRLFREIGLLHPAFFHYGEDDEFINRLRRAGYKVGIVPKVTICHDRPQHRNTKAYFSEMERMKRRYLIELYDHEDPQSNLRTMRNLLFKSALYQFLRLNWKRSWSYIRIIGYLSDRIKDAPAPLFP